MTRRERFWLSLYTLLLLVSLGVLSWPLLFIAAWYLRHIPDRRLPFSEYFPSQPRRFYEWLAKLLRRSVPVAAMLTVVYALVAALGALLLSFALTAAGLLSSPLDILVFWPGLWLLLVNLPIARASSQAVQQVFADERAALQGRTDAALRILLSNVEDVDPRLRADVQRHIIDAEIGINKGSFIVSQGVIQPLYRPESSFARFGGPGLILVQTGHAVVLERRGKYRRVVGEGVHPLLEFELPTLVVPLTDQSTKVEIETVMTKDGGIIRRAECTAVFRLDRGKRTIDGSGRYPCDDELILNRVWGPKVQDPAGSVRVICEGVFRRVIARHSLGEFSENFEAARENLQRELQAEANRVVHGATSFNISMVIISAIVMPEAIESKLIEKWQATQDAIITATRADAERNRMNTVSIGEAKAIAHLELAKTSARTHLIEQIRQTLYGSNAIPLEMVPAFLDMVEKLCGSSLSGDLIVANQTELFARMMQASGEKTFVFNSDGPLMTPPPR